MARAKPAVELVQDGDGWSVRGRSLDPGLLTSFGGRLATLLRVIVADGNVLGEGDLPDVIGDLDARDGEVRFQPSFPFEPGVRYRAILDLRPLGQSSQADVLVSEFSLPKAGAPAPAPEVIQVFPSADVLPENLLRFYVRFSRPMRRGHAAGNIEILGPDGRPAPDVLYRPPVELWDSSMTCLTVLLDPGRLKRGVGPNRALGPPLKPGGRYTLVVGASMRDVRGRELAEPFHKAFTVASAIRAPVTIEDWRISAPAAGSRAPLEATFPAPLDWAQLWRAIKVASDGGAPIGGRVDVDQSETRWRFTPDAAWRAGVHEIIVSPDLEDPCGNTPYAAFDGPCRGDDDIDRERAVRSMPFEVSAR
jgi:hypothetical protein